MRKTIEILLLIITVLLFITAFVSCKRNGERAQVAAAESLSKGFSCNAQLSLDGKAYAFAFSKNAQGQCDLTFTKPAELSTLGFELGSDGLKIKYNGIEAAIDPSTIPQSAVFSAVLGVFNAASGQSGVQTSLKGQDIRVTGTSQAGPFTLTLDHNLAPKELDMPSLKLKATFSNFKYL
jgi:hypothetical protein